MNTGRYGTIRRANAPLTEPGYIAAWISFPGDFTALQTPTLSTPAVLGEAYTIGTSHTWTAGKEPIAILVKQDSIEGDGESVGDVGGGRMVYKPKLFIKGDGAQVLEITDNLLNDEYILFVQDSKDSATYIQYGDASLHCQTEKESFKSGTLLSGGKGTELTVRAFSKYFYTGTISTRA